LATANQHLSDFDLSKVPDGSSMKFAILVAEWNQEITSNLKKGAYHTLLKCGVLEAHVLQQTVPGSFELPLGAQFILESHPEIDAVICLGSVIQGETKHFDYVCQAVALGIKEVALKYNKPVIFGVLTDNNIEQSRARSGGALGNKGDEAAVTAIKMVALKQALH
jgi:6,7-dimethyl-8-ribityllumazine synthase